VTESAARTVWTGVEEMQPYAGKPGLVIAMDGPAGAMYRALTWWLREHEVDLHDTAAVLAHMSEPRIAISTDPGEPWITVDGKDVAGPIRTRDVSNSVSLVAAVPQVRARLIAMQRDIIASAAADEGIVAEGRDVGTVVAPEAAIKVYLTASEDVRAQRRSADLAADPAATVETTRREQARRDERDAAQSIMADDAIHVDTSRLGLDEVVALVTDMARARQAVSRG
jgi:CMP/dCMP kinase